MFMLTIFVGHVEGLAPRFIKNTTLLGVGDEINETKKPVLPFWLQYGVAIGMVMSVSHIVENYAYYSPKSATVGVLQWLFNTSIPGLRIPDLTNKPGRFLSLEAVGKIVRLIYQAKYDDALEEKKVGRKDWLVESLNNLEDNVWTLAKKNKLTDIGQQKLKDIYKEFVKELVAALDECNYWGVNNVPLYPEHLVLYFIYAFVNKKAEGRTDLSMFFKGLCQEKLKGTDPSQQSKWAQEKFGSELPTEKTVVLSASDTFSFEKLEETLCAGVLMNWITSDLPPLFEYKNVTSQVVRGVHFPDCFESTLRNVFNIVAYDKDTGLFSAKKLEETVPTVLKEISVFYQDFSGKKDGEFLKPYTSSDLESDILETAWLDRVIKNNIPYATYRDLYDKKGKKLYEARPKQGPFLVCLPDASPLLDKKDVNEKGFYENVLTIGDMKYHAFTPSSGLFGYELVPYVHSFIILMNYLCGLDLFKEVDLGQELLSEGFEANYISTLSNKNPFERIIYSKGANDELNIVVSGERAFVVQLNRGLHAFITLFWSRVAEEIKTVWQDQLFAAVVNPEVCLLIAHAFDLAVTKSKALDAVNQSFFYRGNWAMNSRKLGAIKQLATQATAHPKNKDFYVESIKMITAKFHLVERDFGELNRLGKAASNFLGDKAIADAILAPFFFEVDKFKGCVQWPENDMRWDDMGNIINYEALFVPFVLRLQSFKNDDLKVLWGHELSWIETAIKSGDKTVFELVCKLISEWFSKETMEKNLLAPGLIELASTSSGGRNLQPLINKMQTVLGKEKTRQLFLDGGGKTTLWFDVVQHGDAEAIRNFFIVSKELLTNEEFEQSLVQVDINGNNFIMAFMVGTPDEVGMKELLALLQKYLPEKEFAKQVLLKNKEGEQPYAVFMRLMSSAAYMATEWDGYLGAGVALLAVMSKVLTSTQLLEVLGISSGRGDLVFRFDPSLRVFNLLMKVLSKEEKETLFLKVYPEPEMNLLVFYMCKGHKEFLRVFEVFKTLPQEVQAKVVLQVAEDGQNMVMKALGNFGSAIAESVLAVINVLNNKERAVLFGQESTLGYNAIGSIFLGARSSDDPQQFLKKFLQVMDSLPLETRKKLVMNKTIPELFDAFEDKPELIMLVKDWAKSFGVILN